MDKDCDQIKLLVSPPTTYGASFADADPVLEQSRLDHKKKRGKKEEKSGDGTTIQPSLSTRVVLQTNTKPIEVGVKYTPPRTKKQKRMEEERRRQFKEDLTKTFCKWKPLQMPPPIVATKLDVKLQAPSAEIKEAKVPPRRPSVTPSDLRPEAPKRRELEAHKPKSGTFINEALRKRKRIKKVKRRRPPPPMEPSIEELMAEELATIQEIGEGGEHEYMFQGGEGEGAEGMEEDIPENYLTRQFRRKVSQLSKTTSVKSKYLDLLEEEGEGEEGPVEEEEDKFINVLVQKFKRDSEIKRYEPPRMKPKKGTFENFSFTKLKQPTLKTFYYGVKLGTIHQGDDHFPAVSRNKQGICVPIAAFCFSILKHPNQWNQVDIDNILDYGNDLFLESAGSHHRHGDNIELANHSLMKYCRLGTHKVRFVVGEPEVSGLVRSDDKKIFNLTKAINIFFQKYPAGVLQTDNLTVALWKDKHFYFFDGQPRTIDLFSNDHGTALLAHFYDTTSVITVLLNRSGLENPPFMIFPIKGYKVLKRDAEEVDSTGTIPEQDNFKVLDEEKAVALGSFDLADKCFGFSRNKQAVTISVIALVYSKITPPSSWFRGTIDKIVIIGNQLFLECIESDSIEQVTIEDLPATFTIGPYVVNIYISTNRCTDFLFKKSKCKLLEKLEKFFETNSNAILEIEKSTLAVWKQRNMYHCFDPYSRNQEGLRCREGAACLSLHTTLQSMINTITANFDQKDTIFRLHALKVCKIHRDPTRNNIFPKGMTMSEYPVENFKKCQMRKSRRRATYRKVTVDRDTRATILEEGEELLDGSILEVGSTVKSLGPDEVPPLVRKEPPIILPKVELPVTEFVADLDSPSLSDTQIEPPPLEEEEQEIEFMDLDSFQLTQEELEMEARGEGEGKDGEDGGGAESGERSQESSLTKEMESMAMSGEGEGQDWYMAQSQFSQVGSHSLPSWHSRLSKDMNTEMYPLEISQEEVPTIVRNLANMVRCRRKHLAEPPLELGAEPDVRLSEELRKETNYTPLPDGTQIVLGTRNMANFGDDLEIMAPFVCIMATTVAKKYSIDSWSKDIVDYVLKCGAELHQSSKTRYDQNYKLEISRISLGHTDFSVKVDYIFDTWIKPRILAMAIEKMLLPRSPCGILVTPTYSCAIFYKNHIYYLYDGFANNEVGLGRGVTNKGVACMARFVELSDMVMRILHNKQKREEKENIEYNRFVLSSCHVKLLTKSAEEEEEEAGHLEAGEGVEPSQQTIYQCHKRPPTPTEPKKSTKRGYRLVDDLWKIEGKRGMGGASQISDQLQEDFFVCLCACLLLLNKPLPMWDNDSIDDVLNQGEKVFQHAENLEICSRKLLKNVLIDDFMFDIVVSRVNFVTNRSRRGLRVGIEMMVAKKHEHFILQFPNRCYVIFVENGVYHLFDPHDKSGKASWIRYNNFRKLVKRLRSGVIAGGDSYNFHSFEITSIANAPKAIKVTNKLKKYKVLKDKKLEMMGRPFYEDTRWLDVEPLPWSWKINKADLPKWRNWFMDFPDDLYSFFGTLSPLDPMFGPYRRKETLAILVVTIGMLHIYDLSDWTLPMMDIILINADGYFHECIKDIHEENYELSVDDITKECTVFPYKFKVKVTPTVEGTMFLVRLKQFNLYKALRLFFDEYDRRFGIIHVTKGEHDKRQYAFGKIHDSEYFFYDCVTLGLPMFIERDSGVPYMLRTTTLNRLLHVMTLTLRGGDFFMYEVCLSEFKPIS